jgi:hypothetical protein
MEEAFGSVVIIICVVAVAFAVASYWGSGKLYRGIGRTGAFSIDDEEPRPTPRPAGGGPPPAEAHEEIRQMVEAKSARRERRGQAPLDVDAEVEALLRPAAPRDQALREEVRQLVIARNERRARQGKPPLDVEEEVERQLRELGP